MSMDPFAPISAARLLEDIEAGRFNLHNPQDVELTLRFLLKRVDDLETVVRDLTTALTGEDKPLQAGFVVDDVEIVPPAELQPLEST